MAVFLLGEAGGDEVAHHAGLVDRLLEHCGEVEARVGTQDGRVERGDALPGCPDLARRSSGPFIGGFPRFGRAESGPGSR